MEFKTMADEKRKRGIVYSKVNDGIDKAIKTAITNCIRKGIPIELINLTAKQFDYFLNRI